MYSHFFYLGKSYEMALQYGIMSDYSSLGLEEYLSKIIVNFLEKRELKLRLGSTLSDAYRQEMGVHVPQSSILSVKLFSIK